MTYQGTTDFIQETGETRVIDGVEIQFQLGADSMGGAARICIPRHKMRFGWRKTAAAFYDLYGVTGEQAVRPDRWVRLRRTPIPSMGIRRKSLLKPTIGPTGGRM